MTLVQVEMMRTRVTNGSRVQTVEYVDILEV